MKFEDIALADVEPGDLLLHKGEVRKVKSAGESDQTMGECSDPECCGTIYYFELWFEDGTWFWGHGNTPMDKVIS
jgi:hypothetical protein